jgi:ankyrin repeat protein
MSSNARRTLEPVNMATVDHTVGEDNAEEGASEDNMELFQRHWSIGSVSDLSPTANHHSQDSTRAPVDYNAFQESWSNSNGGGFLGASFPATGVHPFRQNSMSSLVAPFAGFGVVDRASLGRSVSAVSGPKTDINGVSSIIHDAARITDWHKVLELCESHPEAAAYAGRDGWTALHHACNRRCPRPDVVEALIRAYPAALLQEEEKSWLPLHYACRFKAPKEVVRLLLHMYPDSGRIAVETRDRQGRRPLYYAVRYDAPQGVAGLLLAVDPSAVLEEDQNEESPLALIWDSWAEKLEGKRIVHSFLPGGFPEPVESTVEQRAVLLRQRLEKEPKLKKRWHQVNMLLRAAFGFHFDEDDDSDDDSDDAPKDSPQEKRTWRIVHATAAVKCHLSLFLLACALHPEQARELDEFDLRRPDANGIVPVMTSSHSHQTALHLAASSNAGGEPGKTVIISLLSLYREAAQVQDGIDGSLPLHRMVENPRKQDWPNHAAILYRFYPRAVQIPDHHGKLPLHRATAAITHEDNEGDEERSVIIQLVRSFPQAAEHADETGCLPFHYLAMNAKIWDDDVEAVHNSNRHGVQVRAGHVWNDRLPIHMAAASPKSRESLIQKLIHLHPRGASLEERQGKLPLHLACEQGKKWDAGTRSIYEAFPHAVRQAERNSRGWLPLHMAAACPTASAELIAKLTELFPEAADVPDSEGRYPLHLACSAGKNWLGGLQVLFDANPNALASRDQRGLLPVHICALSYCSKDHSKSKTKAVPKVEAKKEMTVNNEETAQLDILFNLFRSDPTTIE